MARFFIEFPHEAEAGACLRAIRILLAAGSHYLTQADFGCLDGEHKAWIIVDAESKEEARCILPPLYRPQAKIVKLSKFTIEAVDELLRHHEQKQG